MALLGLLIRLIGAAAVIWILGLSGFWLWLGTHPFWSDKVTYIGIGIGIVLSLIVFLISRRAGLGNGKVLIGLIVLTGVVAVIALYFGKAEFVASFAENRFAGKVWFYGFMGMIGSAFATLVQISRVLKPEAR